MSHPTRVRGLKRWLYVAKPYLGTSHPTRVRGLKHPTLARVYEISVAPHTGAWIETCDSSKKLRPYPVAPHTGAWIETAIYHEIANFFV